MNVRSWGTQRFSLLSFQGGGIGPLFIGGTGAAG